jgi:hypothetical protein
MGVLQDVFDALKAFKIAKIDGQPTDNDINKLTMQLTAVLVTILTTNRGGTLGHIRIVVPESRYVALLTGPKLVQPVHPGAYPATASDGTKTCEKEVAKHKAEIKEFETYMACKAWACLAIMSAVDNEWISKRYNEDIGYQGIQPLELLELLRNAGRDLDDTEITDLKPKMFEPWDGVEAPVTMFAKADKYERQLERHSIPKQPELRLLYAVSTYQISGQFDVAMQEWHAKMLANKTFPNFLVYIQNKYTKQVKLNRLTAGSVGKGIANKATKVPEQKFLDAEAQAMVIAEVVNVHQAQNKQQMKNIMSMFKKLLTSMQSSGTPVAVVSPKTPTNHQPCMGCPHCNKKHRDHEKCWELNANKAFQFGKLEVHQERLAVCGWWAYWAVAAGWGWNQ